MRSLKFISVLILSSTQISILPDTSFALTDKECERRYGVTCNHQRDIEQSQSSSKPLVCHQFPNSSSCAVALNGSVQKYAAAIRRLTLKMDALKEKALLQCKGIELARKQGWSANDLATDMHNINVRSGRSPNTNFERQLNFVFLNNATSLYCPQYAEYLRN